MGRIREVAQATEGDKEADILGDKARALIQQVNL
jgi:hypothetical protein